MPYEHQALSDVAADKAACVTQIYHALWYVRV
jgi:hypothetical protein